MLLCHDFVSRTSLENWRESEAQHGFVVWEGAVLHAILGSETLMEILWRLQWRYENISSQNGVRDFWFCRSSHSFLVDIFDVSTYCTQPNAYFRGSITLPRKANQVTNTSSHWSRKSSSKKRNALPPICRADLEDYSISRTTNIGWPDNALECIETKWPTSCVSPAALLGSIVGHVKWNLTCLTSPDLQFRWLPWKIAAACNTLTFSQPGTWLMASEEVSQSYSLRLREVLALLWSVVACYLFGVGLEHPRTEEPNAQIWGIFTGFMLVVSVWIKPWQDWYSKMSQ